MTKKSLILLLLGSAMLTFACLCGSSRLLPSAPTHPLAGSVSTVEPGAACVNGLTEALHTSEGSYLPGSELETDFTLVTYSVQGDQIFDPVKVDPLPPKLLAFQQDSVGHQKLWGLFTNIIPLDMRPEVSEFAVFTDGPNNTLGAVEQTDDPHNWRLEMDIQDGQNFADLSSTLVHEFGHLLTLNDGQIVTDMDVFDHPYDDAIYEREAGKCSTYFMFEGCSKPDSYMNSFFQQFWPDLYEEWQSIDAEPDDDKHDTALDDFYQQYSDQFVSDYAVTSPEEDIAESFMYFIFTGKPQADSIANQKILFFYDFPELITLRERILSHLCTYVVKP